MTQAPHSDDSLSKLFDNARSFNGFTSQPVPDALLQRIYQHMKWGPTSMNCQPLRIRLMVSHGAREQLAECVYEGNRAKVLEAPVCAVFGMDMGFPATLNKVFPHKPDAEAYYEGKSQLVESTAFRNSTLQAGYFMSVARLLGLDCGPMSGFHHDKVNALCWEGTSVRTNFLCNLGYGDSASLFARSHRFDFDEVCKVM